MDGRIVAGAWTIALPAALIGVTIWKFASNPIALIACMLVMVLGALYLVSYGTSY
jgi:hypothetical protein